MDILLVDRLAPEAMEWLKERHSVSCRPELAADPSALRKAVYNTHALVLPRRLPCTRELLDFAPVLRAVARMNAGGDETDLEACRQRGVRVIDAGSASVRSTAEYLLAGLLLLLRPGLGAALSGDRHAEPRAGRELHGSTVGLIGLAPAAHALAGMLGRYGVKLVGYDPAVHASAPVWETLRVHPLPLPELLAQADAVSVQIIYASRYQGFFGARVLAHCKPGQVWVGTSRSSLFDGDALAAALRDGRIESCLLDGAEAGFATRGTALHELRNLVLTPRLGSFTREARQRASWHVAHRLHEALQSQPGIVRPAHPGAAGTAGTAGAAGATAG